MRYDLVFIRSLALDEGIPFTDPAFYSSETRCTDSSIAHIFRATTECKEDIPLLKERIAILRENGSILCKVRLYLRNRSSVIKIVFITFSC